MAPVIQLIFALTAFFVCLHSTPTLANHTPPGDVSSNSLMLLIFKVLFHHQEVGYTFNSSMRKLRSIKIQLLSSQLLSVDKSTVTDLGVISVIFWLH